MRTWKGSRDVGLTAGQGVVWIDIPQGRGFPSLSAERSAASQDGRLQLSWRIPGGEGLTAIVSRRDSCSEWASLDTISIGQDEIVSYEDRSVFEGQSLCYRIGVHACGRDNVLSESWISIPAGRGFVGTAATLIRATADSAGAHLAWQMQSGPPSRAHIYRQDTSHAWALLQDYPMVPGETLEFVDRTVRASKRYEYCLGLWNCGVETRFGAAVVQTPAISRLSVPLALRGGWPNPTHSKLTVAFSLASADLARLDVFDAGGRMVMSRSVGSLGAGEHLLALEGSTLPLRPGLYIVRLSQGGRKLSARVVLLP